MEGSCSTGQSPQWAVVPVEEEEEEEEVVLSYFTASVIKHTTSLSRATNNSGIYTTFVISISFSQVTLNSSLYDASLGEGRGVGRGLHIFEYRPRTYNNNIY
jgi:hypothetical protein